MAIILEGDANVWRFTGPAENFLTAVSKGFWAFNEHNRVVWNRIKEGDLAFFHSTKASEYSNKTNSAIVGVAVIGKRKFEKSDYWWIQEHNEQSNLWPLAVELKEISLFKDFSTIIDFKKDNHLKDIKTQLIPEIEQLSLSGILISKLQEKALTIEPTTPNFPVNGSASKINPLYEELVLNELKTSIFEYVSRDDSSSLENSLESIYEIQKLDSLSKTELMNLGNKYKHIQEHHRYSNAPKKIRIESVAQKKIVKLLEDHTCQICGYVKSYINRYGKTLWVIHADHIIDKSYEGGETLDNLWVLCPTCHAEKTVGLITIDPVKKKVFKDNVEVELIRDSHLGWWGYNKS